MTSEADEQAPAGACAASARRAGCPATRMLLVVETATAGDAERLAVELREQGWDVRPGYGSALGLGLYTPADGAARAVHVEADMETARELGVALQAHGFTAEVGEVDGLAVAFFYWSLV